MKLCRTLRKSGQFTVVLSALAFSGGCTHVVVDTRENLGGYTEYSNSNVRTSQDIDVDYDGAGGIRVKVQTTKSKSYQARDIQKTRTCNKKKLQFGALGTLITLPFGVLQFVFDWSKPGCWSRTDEGAWRSESDPPVVIPYQGLVRLVTGRNSCLSFDTLEKTTEDGTLMFSVSHSMPCIPYVSASAKQGYKEQPLRFITEDGSADFSLKYKVAQAVAEKKPATVKKPAKSKEPPPPPYRKQPKDRGYFIER